MMKKKSFLAYVLAFCLIVPALFIFTACGHKHSYAEEWTKDAEYHWHACTGKDCKEVSEKAKHSYANENDTDCDVCGYVRALNQENVITENVKERTYNGEAQGLVQGTDFTVTNGTASVSYKVKGTNDNFVQEAPKDAGTYVARVMVSAGNGYKSAYKQIEFTIAKYKLSEFEVKYEFSYDRNTIQRTIYADVNGKMGKEKVYLEYTFDSAEIGTLSTEATLKTDNTKTNLNNYEIDKTKISGVIVGKFVYLDSTKARYLELKISLDGGFDLIIKDKSKFGIDESYDVSFTVAKTSDWNFGDTITLVASGYEKGVNELITLSGTDANKYTLKGSVDLVYTERKSAFTGSVLGESSYIFGANGDIIKYGATSFTVNKNENNNWSNLLFTAENFEKEVEINVICGSTTIAIMRRVGENSAYAMKYVYNGGTYDNDNAIATFNLLPNVEGYTDGQGRWICETPSVTLSVNLTFTDINTIADIPGRGVVFGEGRLLTGETYVIKLLGVGSNDEYYNLTIAQGLKITVKVFTATDWMNGNNVEHHKGEMLKSSDIFVIESGEQYKNAVYVYITVVKGTASSTLTIRQVSP